VLVEVGTITVSFNAKLFRDVRFSFQIEGHGSIQFEAFKQWFGSTIPFMV
jgi:hypothetical protein